MHCVKPDTFTPTMDNRYNVQNKLVSFFKTTVSIPGFRPFDFFLFIIRRIGYSSMPSDTRFVLNFETSMSTKYKLIRNGMDSMDRYYGIQ